MYQTLSGKEPAEVLLAAARQTMETNNLQPHLAIVIVGEDKPSQIYVKKKKQKAESLGIQATLHSLPASTSEKELLKLVDKLNSDPAIHGFIIQSPLPPQINTQKVFACIAPEKDVDGFHPQNMGKVFLNINAEQGFAPATPSGIMYLLDYYKVPLEGKHAVVIGRSNIVGKPVALMLLHKNATVTLCHTKTRELAKYTKEADVLIAAAGSPGLVKADMVKEGAHIIDVGTTRVKVGNEDKVVGDVDFEHVIKKAYCSPVPGGVGPLTVAMLLSNTVKAALHAKK